MPPAKVPWRQRATSKERVHYALVPEDAPPARAGGGDVEDARATRARDLVERSGGRRIGEVLRTDAGGEKRLELWATREGDGFIAFGGVFLEALTLLDDGRALINTGTLTKKDQAEQILLRHAKEIASERNGTAKPVKHEDGETWLAINEGLAPERAHRATVTLRLMTLGAIFGMPLAVGLGSIGDLSIRSLRIVVDLAFAGFIGGMLVASIALLPILLLWGPLRLRKPGVADRAEGPYRAAGTRPNVRVAAPAIKAPEAEAPDSDREIKEEEEEANRRDA